MGGCTRDGWPAAVLGGGRDGAARAAEREKERLKALLVSLKNKVEKYSSLICCERKILYHG